MPALGHRLRVQVCHFESCVQKSNAWLFRLQFTLWWHSGQVIVASTTVSLFISLRWKTLLDFHFQCWKTIKVRAFFLWTFVLFDLPIFYSLEARCEGVSVYFTVFSSLSTLLKRFRVLCPCVCRNVCCLPPPNPNSKPGLNPTEWGKMVIQSNRLLKQCWIKHPRLAHLHWPCKKKILSVIGGSTTHFSILRFIPVSCRI